MRNPYVPPDIPIEPRIVLRPDEELADEIISDAAALKLAIKDGRISDIEALAGNIVRLAEALAIVDSV